MLMRRRPILRTAVVGGVAYSAGSHVAKASAAQAQQEDMQNAQIAELQQQQDMQQQAAPPPAYQQPAPPPPPQEATPESPGAMNADKIEQLKQIGELHASGVLNDDEFESVKQKILSSF